MTSAGSQGAHSLAEKTHLPTFVLWMNKTLWERRGGGMTSDACLGKVHQRGTKPWRLRIASGRDSRGGQAILDRWNSLTWMCMGSLKENNPVWLGCRCKAGTQCNRGEPRETNWDLGLILKTTVPYNGFEGGLWLLSLPTWMGHDCWKAVEQSNQKQVLWTWAAQVPISLAVWPRASFLTSLRLGTFIYHLGIMRIKDSEPHEAIVRIKVTM